MLVLMSPWLMPIAVFLGGILSPVLGWARAYRDAKKAGGVEKLDIRRVVISTIIAAIFALIFLGQYTFAVSIGLPDLELAFIAGFGADKIVKNAIGI